MAEALPQNYRIDGLQYANWSRAIFEQMRTGKVDAVHVTIAYHENFREMVLNIEQWNRWFEQYPNLIVPAKCAEDVKRAQSNNQTAIIFGFQTPAPIEDDIGLVEIVHSLGVRFMQLTYNNQSLLATGCYEQQDTGITRMGREVIREMNRVGLVIDMSHSAEQSTLQAAETSERPIVISHANPNSWHPALRNKSDSVLKAIADCGGMIGFSVYPHHLQSGSDCSITQFCQMVADTAELIGIEHLALGTDLCQDQPNSVVDWMRMGRWTKQMDYGEGSATNAGFPDMPEWFVDNRDFDNIERGLAESGFSESEVHAVMGNNWLRFFDENFSALPSTKNVA